MFESSTFNQFLSLNMFFLRNNTHMQQYYGGIIRRQQHLIRCLGGDHQSNNTLLSVTRMQSVMNPTLEAETL
ncbi:hypothetical protein HanHA300_Chr04g0141431 [Helianthus annuus]|uniref:Uncharacterized protein n=1 Tax=Helianthus annuus TaxID=4232 RepID=A0A251V042_HELAN|nr:hypothetical protein HanHA300_Chr04g0141431 [Helianthus annuus]KAJ0597420.1 hypothetical protein HanHA89_Chr04g0154411 [Helianthus annuus]KAJ0761744.1 hypothetical protein HanOQP8_Chr04g0153471 [Helianthus annuus]